MAEYIEREAFIAEKREYFCMDCNKRKGIKGGKVQFCYDIGDAPCRSCDVEDMLDYIDSFPAADVRPVVHAHWEIANMTYENSTFAPWICSECKKHGENYRWYGSKPTWIKFCEACGAVMDEEVDDG